MVNWDRIAQLQEEVGQDDFTEVVEMFFEEVEEVLVTLGNDSAALARELHFLKGSALNLGFQTMATLCKDAEISSEQHKTIIGIQKAYQEAKTELSAIA